MAGKRLGAVLLGKLPRIYVERKQEFGFYGHQYNIEPGGGKGSEGIFLDKFYNFKKNICLRFIYK